MRLLKEKFPDSTIISNINEGINSSCLFELENRKYVAKSFSADHMDKEDYIASVQISEDYLDDGNYLNIPSVYQSGIFEDTAYVVYEYIEGNQLESNNILGDSMNASDYIYRIGRILSELHNQENPVDGFGWYTVDGNRDIMLKNRYDNATDMMMSYLNYNLENIESDSFVDQYAEKLRYAIKNNTDYTGQPRICHCDVKYNNIIETGESNLYLIDWEFLRSADPMYDYVKTERQFLARYSQDITEKLQTTLKNELRSSYFDDGQFDRSRYHAYWIQVMVECFRECSNWYPEEEVQSVRNYYMRQIDRSIESLS